MPCCTCSSLRHGPSRRLNALARLPALRAPAPATKNATFGGGSAVLPKAALLLAGPPLGRRLPQPYQASCQPAGRRQALDQSGCVRLGAERSATAGAIFLSDLAPPLPRARAAARRRSARHALDLPRRQVAGDVVRAEGRS